MALLRSMNGILMGMERLIGVLQPTAMLRTLIALPEISVPFSGLLTTLD